MNKNKCEHGRNLCPCNLTNKDISQEVIDFIMFDEKFEPGHKNPFYLTYWLSPDGVLYHVQAGSHSMFFHYFIKDKDNRKQWVKIMGGRVHLHKGSELNKKQSNALFDLATLTCHSTVEDMIDYLTWDCKEYGVK